MYGNCSNALYARDKKRLSLAACWVGLAVAAVLPARLRAGLCLLYTGLLNPPQDTLRIFGAWLSDRIAAVLIFFLYWVVLAPCALAQRLSAEDWLGQRPKTGSFFTPRAACDDDNADLRRPY